MTIDVAVRPPDSRRHRVRYLGHVADDEGEIVYRLRMEAGQVPLAADQDSGCRTAHHVPSSGLLDRCERTLDRPPRRAPSAVSRRRGPG